jgi:hypothetical protein
VGARDVSVADGQPGAALGGVDEPGGHPTSMPAAADKIGASRTSGRCDRCCVRLGAITR